MANKRMGTRLITGTIDFLNLPKAAQALYQQCTNESDDDGIVDARLIMRVGNFRKRDLDALLNGDYVRLINAKKSIVWVTNWQRYNTIKKGRGIPSVYREDLIRAVPDIKNALFKPKTDNKWRTNDSPELELELELEPDKSRSELELESESELRLDRMASPSGDFFTEQCPPVMEEYLQNLIYEYGDSVYTKIMCVVALKMFRLRKWCPDTCTELAERFMELNEQGVNKKWSGNKWQAMLDKFVSQEMRDDDYMDWVNSAEEEEYDDLPFE